MKNKFALALLVVAFSVSGAHNLAAASSKEAVEVKAEEKKSEPGMLSRGLSEVTAYVNWAWNGTKAEPVKVGRFAAVKNAVSQKVSSGVAAVKNGVASTKQTIATHPRKTVATLVAATALAAGAYTLYANQEDADSAE